MFVSHYVKPVLVLIFNISNELRSGFLLKRLSTEGTSGMRLHKISKNYSDLEFSLKLASH